MELIKEFIEPFTNKFMSDAYLEHKENCKKFCKDLEKSINENKNISNKFDIKDLSQERYYNFFEFDEYKKINKNCAK